MWVAFLAVALSSGRPGGFETPTARKILLRAEQARNPDLDYAVDFTIRTFYPEARWPERKERFTMVAHGRDHCFILRRTPALLYGGILMIAEDDFWVLLPQAGRPFQLAEATILRGDMAAGDLARINLDRGYEPRLAGEEYVEGEACYKLELKRVRGAERYSRVLAWIGKKSFLPRKFEYYGPAREPIKRVRYDDYRRGSLGILPMKVEIEGSINGEAKDRIEFDDPRPINVTALVFGAVGMVRFRDAALAGKEAEGLSVRPESFLRRIERP